MEKLLSEIAFYADLLYKRRLTDGSAGNISLLRNADESIDETPSLTIGLCNPVDNLSEMELIITAAGSRMYTVSCSPAEFTSRCRFSKDGRTILVYGDKKPSSEIVMHSYIYGKKFSKNNQGGCIIHAHPLYSVAASIILKSDEKAVNSIFNDSHFEFKYIFKDKIGCLECVEPGTEELAEKSSEKFEFCSALLLERHGIISYGADPAEAYDRIDSAEAIAKIAFISGLIRPI